MWHAVPVEDLLLFLCSYAIILVQEIQERAFRLFQRCIGTRLEVSQIGENTLFEFLLVFDRSAESLEAKRQASDNVSA